MLWMAFDLVLQNFQNSTFASVNNIANTQMCYVCSCSCFVLALLLTLGNNHSHSNKPPMVSRKEWPNATAGMPGIIELELGRSGKI